jgi:hypothetical protein
MVRNQLNHRNIYSYEATAYHEAGHAIVMLLLGVKISRIEITEPRSGYVRPYMTSLDYWGLVKQASKSGHISVQLFRHWLDRFWISDSGAIAEAEFNLVSDNELISGSFGDLMSKVNVGVGLEEYPGVKEYFHKYVGRENEQITKMCLIFMRNPKVSWLIRTLADSLMRTPNMDGEEVVDTLLSNKASKTRHFDMFWEPLDYELWKESMKHKIKPKAKQLRLFG